MNPETEARRIAMELAEWIVESDHAYYGVSGPIAEEILTKTRLADLLAAKEALRNQTPSERAFGLDGHIGLCSHQCGDPIECVVCGKHVKARNALTKLDQPKERTA